MKAYPFIYGRTASTDYECLLKPANLDLNQVINPIITSTIHLELLGELEKGRYVITTANNYIVVGIATMINKLEGIPREFTIDKIGRQIYCFLGYCIEKTERQVPDIFEIDYADLYRQEIIPCFFSNNIEEKLAGAVQLPEIAYGESYMGINVIPIYSNEQLSIYDEVKNYDVLRTYLNKIVVDGEKHTVCTSMNNDAMIFDNIFDVITAKQGIAEHVGMVYKKISDTSTESLENTESKKFVEIVKNNKQKIFIGSAIVAIGAMFIKRCLMKYRKVRW